MDEMLRFLFKSTMRTESALRAIAKPFKHHLIVGCCLHIWFFSLDILKISTRSQL